MISTPASNMRMRSRLEDCRVSKVDISREKNGSGAKLIATSAAGTAHATARGFFRITSTSTAATHPIHALRVYVSSTASDERNAVAASHGLRRSWSQSATANTDA